MSWDIFIIPDIDFSTGEEIHHRVSGYDHIPEEYRESVTSAWLAKETNTIIEYVETAIKYSEYLRRLAYCKALHWQHFDRRKFNRDREKRRMGL